MHNHISRKYRGTGRGTTSTGNTKTLLQPYRQVYTQYAQASNDITHQHADTTKMTASFV